MKLLALLACAAVIAIPGAIGTGASSPADAAKKVVRTKAVAVKTGTAALAKRCSPNVPYWWCSYQDPKLTGYGPPPNILAPWGVIRDEGVK